MRNIFVVCFLLISLSSIAQIERVDIGINGLTCSQCSKSVLKRIEKLNYVEHVDVDLANTLAVVTIDKNKSLNVSTLSQAVRDAGFSVRNFIIYVPSQFIKDKEITIGQDKIKILSELPSSSTSLVKIQLLGKKFSEKFNAMYDSYKGIKGEMTFYGNIVN